MNFDRGQLQILQESLRRFQMKSDVLASKFHHNLLSDAPDTLAFFSKDAKGEPEKLLQSLYAVVILLDGNAESQHMICRLKQRQKVSGIGADTFAQILPIVEKSLRDVFYDSLPEEYYVAWTSALEAVSQIMYGD